jgi:cardiolipin synthase A/B
MATRIFPSRPRHYHICKAELIKSGSPFFQRLLQLIDDATDVIHIQTYIFGDDETGHSVAAALKRAAARGVRVFLLADGYASDLSKSFIREMRSSGIRFRYFEPIFRSSHFYFGRRLHHKVIVIDGEKALVGGINLADRYNDMPTERAWMDMALEVNGSVALELQQICVELWRKKTISTLLKRKAPALMHEAQAKADDCLVRVRRNDWVMAKEQIWRSYAGLFRRSEQEIIIMCSYFLPGRVYQKILKKAVERGVKVKVILAGQSDVKIAKNAERYLYRWMLRNGVQVYEFQPTVLHAKVAVIDGLWLTVGSYNINDISAYASIELNLEVRDARLGKELRTTLNDIIAKDCIAITKEKAVHLFSWAHIKQLLSFYFIRVVLKMTTFYFKRHE